MERIEAFAEPGIWARGFRILVGLTLLGVAGVLVYTLPSGSGDASPTAPLALHVIGALACLAAATALIAFDDGGRLRVGQDLKAYRTRRAVVRRVVDAAALLSLLLCVAVVVLWVRSHFVREQVSWRAAPDAPARAAAAAARPVTAEAHFFDGRVYVGIGTWRWLPGGGAAAEASAPPKPKWDRNVDAAPSPANNLSQRLGFGLDWQPATDTVNGRYAITFPAWLAATALGVFPAARVYLRHRRRVRATVAVGGTEVSPVPEAGPFEPLVRHTERR